MICGLEETLELEELENHLGYRFRNRKLLRQALVHSSFAFEADAARESNNETLEFLGDAVLDLTVGSILFAKYPAMREGELTKLRASLVQEEHLAIMARELGLGKYLFLGKGEEATGGREKPSLLACAFEAVTGAIFLDGKYEAALAFVNHHFTFWIDKGRDTLHLTDAKSRLQEITQAVFNETPEYLLEKEEGPDHDKQFTVAVSFREKILATGTAKSKKEAAKKAAINALKRFDPSDHK